MGVHGAGPWLLKANMGLLAAVHRRCQALVRQQWADHLLEHVASRPSLCCTAAERRRHMVGPISCWSYMFTCCTCPCLLQEREQLLEEAAAGGAIKERDAWRVSLKGKRFRLKGVKLFNVSELDGKCEACVRVVSASACNWRHPSTAGINPYSCIADCQPSCKVSSSALVRCIVGIVCCRGMPLQSYQTGQLQLL